MLLTETLFLVSYYWGDPTMRQKYSCLPATLRPLLNFRRQCMSRDWNGDGNHKIELVWSQTFKFAVS